MIKLLPYFSTLPDNSFVVDTTSRSNNWSKGLSPFFSGPVRLYGLYVAQNVENAWQFSKVYKQHLTDGKPNSEYFKWAKNGWDDTRAHRYPMGKGAKPEFSWWNGEKLSYIETRNKIYIPLYSKAVEPTDAFKKLQETYQQCKENDLTLCLKDFDAYDYQKLGMTFDDVIHDSTRKMGHAFVLAMMLERYIMSGTLTS